MWLYAAYAVVGLATGFASALLGVGGGIVMVPMLILLFSLPAKAAAATSLALIVPVALTGTILQWRRGEDIRWMLALLALPTALLGTHLGTAAKMRISNTHLKVIFGLVLVLVGVKLGLEGWKEWRHERAAGPSVEAPARNAGEDSL